MIHYKQNRNYLITGCGLKRKNAKSSTSPKIVTCRKCLEYMIREWRKEIDKMCLRIHHADEKAKDEHMRGLVMEPSRFAEALATL